MNQTKELTYTLVGDYYLPNLLPPQEPKVGIWGQRRRRYLREHRSGLYTGMLLAGTLGTHLAQIDEQAQEMLARISARLATSEEVTEELKVQDQIEWVRRMNSIRSRAAQIVNKELIFV